MIRQITPTMAVKILKEHGFDTSVARLELGLRQRVFPFGDAVEMKGGTFSYAIYSVLLDKWIAERSTSNE